MPYAGGPGDMYSMPNHMGGYHPRSQHPYPHPGMTQIPPNGMAPGMGMNPGITGPPSGSFGGASGGSGADFANPGGDAMGIGDQQGYQPNFQMPGGNPEVGNFRR